MYRDSPRLGVCLWIVDGHFDLQMSEIRASEAFNDFAGLGQRAAFHIQPSQIAEFYGFHDQRVAFPFAARVAEPPRLSIRGHRTTVGEDLPQSGVRLINN